jgi:methionyl aminopeptidase
MHEDLQVPNYRTGRGTAKMVPGVCMAIEPMLALGSADCHTLADGWTVVTNDRSLAAHFEHTIAVTENGPVILTTA